MQLRASRIAIFVVAALAGSGATAYVLSGMRWMEPRAVMHVGMSGNAPNGTPWSTVLQDEMRRWTDRTLFRFVADPGYVDPCAGFRRDENNSTGFPAGDGDAFNGIDFKPTVCGNEFGTGTLAITLSSSVSGPFGFPQTMQSDIVFNSNVQWDLYAGPRSGNPRFDFRRTALHEFGHVLGLNHENLIPSVMAPRFGEFNELQADDIAGANALYADTNCRTVTLTPGVALNERLELGDCRVKDFFAVSDDTSFVDVYRLSLPRDSDLQIALHSSDFDPVLVISDARFGGLEIHDDFEGGCDARISKRLPAGEYRILVNTYEEPEKCGGKTGGYMLTLSDSTLPLLGHVKSVPASSTAVNAIFSGGATANGGASYPAVLQADLDVNVVARIQPDSQHVGRAGRLYVLAMLSDGRRLMQDADGRFQPFDGNFATLVPRRAGTLAAQENLSIASRVNGRSLGLVDQSVYIYLGYALESSPATIWYGANPIRVQFIP